MHRHDLAPLSAQDVRHFRCSSCSPKMILLAERSVTTLFNVSWKFVVPKRDSDDQSAYVSIRTLHTKTCDANRNTYAIAYDYIQTPRASTPDTLHTDALCALGADSSRCASASVVVHLCIRERGTATAVGAIEELHFHVTTLRLVPAACNVLETACI